jgi:hypothetical protein
MGSEAMEAEQVSKKSAWRPVIREIYEEYRGHSRRQAYYGSSSAS